MSLPTPTFDQDGLQVYTGNALTVLPTLPAGIARCCVTSPPYWGLRDYGHDDQIGLEPTPDCGRPFMQLRPDLTDAQREFARQRLLDAGLLDAWPCGMSGKALPRCRLRTEAPDGAPKPECDEPQVDRRDFCNHNNANHPEPKQPVGNLDIPDFDNQMRGPESDPRSNLDGSDQLGACSLGDDSRPLELQTKSLRGDPPKALDPSTPERLGASLPTSTERQQSLACLCANQKSSSGPLDVKPGCRADSPTSSCKSSSRNTFPCRHNGDGTACTFASSVWAYYILPQEVRALYRHQLCSKCYVCRLVEVFREVRRVLTDDATLWLNLGDSYAGSGKGDPGDSPHVKQRSNQGSCDGRHVRNKLDLVGDLKPKDLVGIPWMVAFALRADGWYLRADIIWHKPNPMPESVRDRPTKAHEYLFLLAKSDRYFYDIDAIKDPGSGVSGGASFGKVNLDGPGARRISAEDNARIRGTDKQRGHSRRHAGFNDRWDAMERDEQVSGLVNKRDVWTVCPANFPGAHFATFPPDLIEPCVKAGSAVGDIVLDPFNGSGTTGHVCREHGRRYIGIELNAAYVQLTRDRFRQPLLFAAPAGSESP